MLTEPRVREMLRLYENEGWSTTALAKRYKIAPATVSRIITGKTWVHVTGGRNRSRKGARTAYHVAHISARMEQGVTSPSVLADELGISRQAVSKLIHTKRLGARAC